jgi:hypothetical protein
MNSATTHVQAVTLAHRRFTIDGVGFDPLEAFDVAHECRHGNIPAHPGNCGCFTGTASPLDKLSVLQAAAEVRTERFSETFRPANPSHQPKRTRRSKRQKSAKKPAFTIEELVLQIRERGASLCDRIAVTGEADPGQIQEINRLTAIERILTRS